MILSQVVGGVEISKNETEMAQWLISNGPISIGINANAMQFYKGLPFLCLNIKYISLLSV